MKLHLTPTPHFFTTGQYAVRLWTGTDDDGREINAFIACIAIKGEAVTPELLPIPGPSIPPLDVVQAMGGGEFEQVGPVSIACPRCGKVSFHPRDINEGYCGLCHKFSGDPC